MKALHLPAAFLFLAAVSCERHEWEDTKILHESHGHAADADGGHGEKTDGAAGEGH